jgi:hypothetical protein
MLPFMRERFTPCGVPLKLWNIKGDKRFIH